MQMTALEENVLRWFGHGRVGLSSKTMAMHLTGMPCAGDYPHDPDDLDRCLRFLEAVPEARAELPRMAQVNATWAALVARWEEIEASFLAEFGADRSKRGTGVTYRLMRSIIDGAGK